VEIIPTGGVEPNAVSIKEWLDAGVLCVGMAGLSFSKKNLSQKGAVFRN